ncbi:hypothetical protein V5F77_27345 [Xanthobacter sp. DSM 24535]|uniref:hypothetical protein n=1 Tax=Roseixanthobacter psychrophilus TaxID=3119917 RepID=UPI00372AA7DA
MFLPELCAILGLAPPDPAALFEAIAPLDAPAIAAVFKPGPKVRAQVADVLLALFRMGLVSSPDGKSFALRRAA